MNCFSNNRKGFKYGKTGKCYTGSNAESKAKRQGAAIKASGYLINDKDAKLERAGVSGYNKPKRTPNHPTKSHIVVAKEGGKTKTIRFGQQGVKGAGSNPKTEKEKNRRKAFKARHAENIARGKMSAAYWSNLTKW